MTVNALPPVPDSNSWIINGQPSQALVEYMNAVQRQGNEIRSAITALEEQDGELAAGIDAIDVTQESNPGRVFLGTVALSGVSQEITGIPPLYSALEVMYLAASSTGAATIILGIDDAGGASYVTQNVSSLANASASADGRIIIRRVNEIGVNKVCSKEETGGSTNFVMAETGLIDAVRLSVNVGSFDAGNFYLFGLK
jgi:hypothetical protein